MARSNGFARLRRLRRAAAAKKPVDAAASQVSGPWEHGPPTPLFLETAQRLTSDDTAERLAAIYALEHIVQQSIERNHIAFMAILSELIRDPPYDVARWPAERFAGGADTGTADDRLPPRACPDILAAISVISQRNARQLACEKHNDHVLSLADARLAGLDLAGASLGGLRFENASLCGANLFGANLSGAIAVCADLAGATLAGADLTAADLSGADITGANLAGARLVLADLTAACLADTRVDYAELCEAFLAGADLADACLIECNFASANLFGALNVTQAQLDSARATAPPRSLPDGLKWHFVEEAGRWVRRP